MRIAFFGVEDLGVFCLKALLKAGYPIVGVVTLPSAEPRATGLRRFLSREPESVEAIAQARRLPLLQPLKLRDPAFQAELAAWRPDLLVVACFDKILPPEVLAIAPRGGVNVHPSLLPRFRGPAPVARALLNGDAETGLTIHCMDQGVDTGDCLVQKRWPIRSDDTAGSLLRRLAEAAPEALLEAISGLQSGSLSPKPQQGAVVPAPFISWPEAQLDWRAEAARIERTVRACSPYPGAFTIVQDQVVALLQAEVVLGDRAARPGQVLAVSPAGVVIQAGDRAVRCRSLRRGGAPIPPEEWPSLLQPGAILPSGDWSSPLASS